MPVYSMTGYASVQHSVPPAEAESSAPALRLGLEIRSVNSRFLDLTFRLPEELRQLEPGLRELITRRLRRGKVEVRASFALGEAHDIATPSTPRCSAWPVCRTRCSSGCPKHAP